MFQEFMYHERFAKEKEFCLVCRLVGHDEAERFKMTKGFIPMEGADGWAH